MSDFKYPSISTKDSQRLKTSFFENYKEGPSSQLEEHQDKFKYFSSTISNKKKVLISTILSIIFLTLMIILLNHSFKKKSYSEYEKYSFNLLKQPSLASIQIINSVDSQNQTKNGLIIDFSNITDLSNSKIVLYVEKSNEEDLQIQTIIRDVNYFSNAKKPIQMQIKRNSKFIEIPIDIYTNDNSPLNPMLGKQIRLLFLRGKRVYEPLGIKEVYLVKKEVK
ncbi:MAG: hypothetical protein NC822_02605 [Candidatus Omnitrophica bacterium]|nr:hypothetical protein [Candidatus Omnitrophota bacterium]MCM8826093.1 hypothetical protein [Candidatus Omnitrophota bacterium]